MADDIDPVLPQQPLPGAPPIAVQDAVRGLLGGMGSAVGGIANSLYTLPQRAFEASEGLRTTGEYNPGPALEASSLLLGGDSPGATLGALHLMPLNRVFPQQLEREYKILDDAGNHVLDMSTLHYPNDKHLSVEWIGKPFDDYLGPAADYYKSAANSVKEIRSLVKALMKEYPDVESIAGERISGARDKSGAAGYTQMQVRKPK